MVVDLSGKDTPEGVRDMILEGKRRAWEAGFSAGIEVSRQSAREAADACPEITLREYCDILSQCTKSNG